MTTKLIALLSSFIFLLASVHAASDTDVYLKVEMRPGYPSRFVTSTALWDVAKAVVRSNLMFGISARLELQDSGFA